FVNGRPIRDRRILHAVQAAYATLLPRGRYPVVYLFIEIPPEEVDVNVHPAKAEVRFLRPGAAHDLVREALLEALGVARPFYRIASVPAGVAEPGAMDASPGTSIADTGRVGVAPGTVPGATTPPRPGAPGTPAGGSGLFEAVSLSPLAQLLDSYILASAPDGLVIVDQHAAHERVLYERLLAESRAGGVPTQRLLFPVTVDVGAALRLAF